MTTVEEGEVIQEGSVAEALIRPRAPKRSLAVRVLERLRAEVADQTDRWRLWAPVFFGGGCAAYFALTTEPAGWPLMLAAVLTSAAWLAGRRYGLARRWTLMLLMLACLALGGCSSVGTFWNFMRGEFMIEESEVQRRLDRRFPRDFKVRDDTLTKFPN